MPIVRRITGHKVWFDEFSLAAGRPWADEMAAGIRDTGSGGLFLFFLDYWGCRRDTKGSNHGFCINEVVKAIENDMPILVIGLSDAIPPPALAASDRNPLTLDVRRLVDDGLSLAELSETHAYKKIKAAYSAGKLSPGIIESCPPFDNVANTTIGMAAYFSYRFGALQSVGAIVQLAEQPHVPTEADVEAAAASIGAMTTRVADYSHKGIDHLEWESQEMARGGGGECQRVFITGDASSRTLMLELRKDLIAAGHVVECDPDRLFGVTIDEEAMTDYATASIHWARGYGQTPDVAVEKPTPLTAEEAMMNPVNGCMLVLMTPEAVRQYPKGAAKDQVMKAKYSSGLDIIPLNVRWCEVPIEICTLQYVDYSTAVERTADGGVAIRRSAYNAATVSLKRTLVDGMERCGNSADAETRLQLILKPPGQTTTAVASENRLMGRGWLLEEVHAWLDDDDAPAVRVYEGETGSGKSMIAKHLAREAQSLAAMHVATADDPDGCSLRRAVLNFAFQLSRRIERGTHLLLGSPATPALYADSRDEPLASGTRQATITLADLVGLAEPEVLFAQLITFKLGQRVAEATSEADHAGHHHHSSASGAGAAAAAVQKPPQHSAISSVASEPCDAAEAYMAGSAGLESRTPAYAAPGIKLAGRGFSHAVRAASASPPVDSAHGPGHLRHSQSVNLTMMEARRRQLKSSKSRRLLVIDGLERLLREDKAATLRQLETIGRDLKRYCPQIRILCLSQPGALGSQTGMTGNTGPVTAGDAVPTLISPNIEVASLLGTPASPRFLRASEDIRSFVYSSLEEMAGLSSASLAPVASAGDAGGRESAPASSDSAVASDEGAAAASAAAGTQSLTKSLSARTPGRHKRGSGTGMTQLVPSHLVKPLSEAICERSGGNFLYANSVLELVSSRDLCLEGVDATPSALATLLPSGMTTVYEKLWEQCSEGMLHAGHDALAVACAIKQPMSFPMLAECALKLRTPDAQNSVLAMLQPMFSLVGSERLLQPFHQGLVEWLVGQQKVDVLHGHELLVEWGRSVLVSAVEEAESATPAADEAESAAPAVIDAETREQVLDLVFQRRGGPYFLLHLMDHADAIKRSDVTTRAADEVLDLVRDQVAVDYAFEASRLRRLGFNNMYHGSISSRGSGNEVEQRLLHAVVDPMPGDFLVRLARTGEIAISRIEEDRRVQHYRIYRLPSGYFTNMDPRANDPALLQTWKDAVGLIASLKRKGILVRLRAPPALKP